MSDGAWRSESGDPAPVRLAVVDDRLTADSAMRRIRRGEHLLYSGDFNNARQLLGALSRRLPKPQPAKSPAQAFAAERRARHLEHETLGHVVVKLDRSYRLALSRAPDVAQACRWVWGEPESDSTLVSLNQLLGMIGAAQWRQNGLDVPGLVGQLQPHYGVYLPTRTDYLELLTSALTAADAKDKRVFDIGTGTGVLSFLLLQRGAASAVGTDVEPRAVSCANANAELLKLSGRYQAVQADLFPEGRADLVVANPPWIPEVPKSRIDRAVFDQGNQFLTGYLGGLRAHLEPNGLGVLVLSNLAVLLGLRSETFLDDQFAQAGLVVKWKRTTTPQHRKAKDKSDRLYAARSKELTTLYALG